MRTTRPDLRRKTLGARPRIKKRGLAPWLLHGEKDREPSALLTPKVISDKILFTLAIGLVLFGIVMVYSASAVLAAEKFEHQYYFLIRQAIWAALALMLPPAPMWMLPALIVATRLRLLRLLVLTPLRPALLMPALFMVLARLMSRPAVSCS